MSDLISRQAAIDTVLWGITHAKAINKDTGEVIELFRQGNEELTKASDRIKDLPSVQEQRWIPVTERMPNGQEEVIVSCHDTSGDGSFGYTSSGWTTTDGEYWIVDNEINHFVVAWMPLPEPYKDGK